MLGAGGLKGWFHFARLHVNRAGVVPPDSMFDLKNSDDVANR